MRKKDYFMIALLAVLAGWYIQHFGHFGKPKIRISPSIRPPARKNNATVFPVIFTLDDSYKLTSLEVVVVETNKPNEIPLPLWHLVAKSNSIPTKIITYGTPIRGMEPAIARLHPQALDPNLVYRLILNAGDVTGQIDFRTRARQPNN